MKKSQILAATIAALFLVTGSTAVFAKKNPTVSAEEAIAEPAAEEAIAEPAAEETVAEPAAEPAAEEAAAPAAEAPAEEAPAEEAKEKTLLEEIGGPDAVKAAVKIFYEKVLADDRVNGYFEGVDMERQNAMQTDFLTFAFGGENKYQGKDLRAAHAHLVAKGLNDTHFDVIVEHLGGTLKELGVKDEQIAKVAEIANSVRADVLNK